MKTILFVCTGNTCRSPMAACLLNHMAELQRIPARAISAGIYAQDGESASTEAINAMARRRLCLKEHQATCITSTALTEVDLIIGMSASHLEALKMRVPRLSIPMLAFSPAIADPFGGNEDQYEKTATELEERIPSLLEHLRLC